MVLELRSFSIWNWRASGRIVSLVGVSLEMYPIYGCTTFTCCVALLAFSLLHSAAESLEAMDTKPGYHFYGRMYFSSEVVIEPRLMECEIRRSCQWLTRSSS